MPAEARQAGGGRGGGDSKGGGGGRGQRGAARGGGRGRRDGDPMVKLSKSLSYVLRHGAEKEGIPMRPDGFVAINTLLAHPRFTTVTLEQVQTVVRDNDKKRFALQELEDGAWYIRANQGHSLQHVEVAMQKVERPQDVPVVVHGTYFRVWPAIAKTGLSVMNRQHVHFAVGRLGEDGVMSGMRGNCEVYVYVDVSKAMQDGIEFLRSENNVILSSGIDGMIAPKYFLKVEDRSGKAIAFTSP